MSQTKAQLLGGVGFSTADSLTVHNGLAVTGVVTATSFSGGASGDFSIEDKIVHTGDTNTAIRFPAADTFTVETAGTERLRVDSTGIVKLYGNGSTQTKIYGYTGGSQLSYIVGNEGSSDLSINNFTANNVLIKTNGSERLRIDSSGRLLVGTASTVDSSSTALLQVSASGGTRFALGNPNTVGAGAAMLGQVGFYGYQGAYALGASITANSDTTWSTDDYPTRLVFSTCADGAATPTERMQIDSSGRVGINTNTPGSFDAGADNLVVGSGSGNNGITIYSGNSSLANFYFADGTSSAAEHYAGGMNYSHSSNNMAFFTNGGQTAMNIDSSQRVLIGTSAATSKLHVIGNEIRFSNSSNLSYYGTLTHDAGTTGANIYDSVDATTVSHIFKTSGTERLRIGSSGQIGLGGANYGTSGQVLTSNGSGSAPTWQSGGGAWNLITTVNASGASQADITGMGATYDQYCIIARNVRGSATDWLYARWFDNGSLITGSVYNVAWYSIVSNSPTTMSSQNETNYFRPGRIGSGTNDRTDFLLWFNATDEDSTNTFNWQFSGNSSVGSVSRFMNGGGAVNTSFTNISGVRFYPSSGTITGNFQLYGIS